MTKLTSEETAVRAHDIVLCMERSRTPEFDLLHTLGLSVRLALHLRGVPPIAYELLKRVAFHLLNFSPAEVQPVVKLLAEAEFLLLHAEGDTIKTVVPDIPYFDNLYGDLAEAARIEALNENEQLALTLVGKLAGSPVLRDHAYNLGAEKKLVDRVLGVSDQGGFILHRRARGKDVLLSPSHFGDSHGGYADVVARLGTGRVRRVLDLLKQYQGWPLAKIVADGELGGCKLDADDLAVIHTLAGDGFVRPPALTTTHAGTNHFLFGPSPGVARLPLHKRSIYEKSMALVAAVRQGQLLPSRYAIRYPHALLRALRDKHFLTANSEAREQYRQVAVMGVGRLVDDGGRTKLELIEQPENFEAIDLALQLMSGGEPAAAADESVVLALRQGEAYVESLIGRKLIAEEKPVALDEECKADIETLIMGGLA